MLTMFGGFTLASISIGWSDGTYSHIIDMFTRNQLGHIQVHSEGYLDRPSLYKVIKDYENVGKNIQSIPDVEAWAPRLYAAGLASVGEKSAGIRIIGLDPESENAATHFDKKIARGTVLNDANTHEALLGKGLARILRTTIGGEVVVVSQAADGSIANDIYAIVGIVDTGDEYSDQTGFYLTLQDAQELFALENRVHEIVVIASNLDRIGPLVGEIEDAVSNAALSVAPWQEFAKSFYNAMRADQEGMWISLFVIILIVAVGVLNTVLMSVLERTREYGVLKALGVRPKQIFGLVLTEVNIMATGSIIIGAGLGILINYLLSIHGISYPQSLTYGGFEFQEMYSEVNARSLIIPAITVIVSASLVATFPAIRASRTAPARAMRAH